MSFFYEQGCRGPMTHSNCNKILWNDVNTKTRVGMPCIGCTELDFPRDNMLETKKRILVFLMKYLLKFLKEHIYHLQELQKHLK